MVTGKSAFIYLTPVLRICYDFILYSERCASQLVMIYGLCQRNNSHMVKPKTMPSEVEELLVKSRQTLFFHTGVR